MSMPDGFYTLAELLRQQARSPHNVGLQKGWEVRLIMGPGEENILPEVELWPDRLVMRIPRAVLVEAVRRIAGQRGIVLTDEQLVLVCQSAFPHVTPQAPVTTGLECYTRIATVQPGERLFLTSARLSPNAWDSFLLEHPMGRAPEAVRVLLAGTMLQVNAPEGLRAQIDAAANRVLRGLFP